jgi:hypothetical protein
VSRRPPQRVGDSTGRLIFGVDFTSAPSARKPITAAVGRWRCGPRATWEVDAILEIDSWEAFAGLLHTPGPWLGGFDLPFGQPRELVEHSGWPDQWPALVQFYCGQPRPVLREIFRAWCDARPPGRKFAWRRTDRPAGSSPAMRWTNPPVAWMMHAGVGRMLDAGLVFPAHRHPPGHRPTPSDRIALEAYPAYTARRACRGSYKSDSVGGRTRGRTSNRRAILASLQAGEAGLNARVRLGASLQRRIIADHAGDLLDAVICGLQAGHAADQPGYGLPPSLDPLEGWIASVAPALTAKGNRSFSE